MRRYGSFLVRWWQAGEAGRLTIRHVQTDEELSVGSLAEATEWMAARVAEAGRAPPPGADEGRGGDDGTPREG